MGLSQAPRAAHGSALVLRVQLPLDWGGRQGKDARTMWSEDLVGAVCTDTPHLPPWTGTGPLPAPLFWGSETLESLAHDFCTLILTAPWPGPLQDASSRQRHLKPLPAPQPGDTRTGLQGHCDLDQLLSPRAVSLSLYPFAPGVITGLWQVVCSICATWCLLPALFYLWWR